MMLDEMCYDSEARPTRERKMPENLTHLESLARAYTGAAIKTLAEIMRDPSAPARARSAAAAILHDYGFPSDDAAGDRRAARVARAHIEKAASGDMQAIKELADRLDGKPAQILDLNDPDPITKIVTEIVHVHETREEIEQEQEPLLIEWICC